VLASESPVTQPEAVPNRCGRRSLRYGAPRQFGDHAGYSSRWYSEHFKALKTRLGPFDGISLQYAGATAVLWVTFKHDTRALEEAQRQRAKGKGRRPSASAIARLEKRQGLAWQSYDSALRRLEELTRKNGHGGGAELEAVMRG
jgi:hypothetical protein